MKVLIDGIEVPCHSDVKIIYDSLIGGELHIAHNHERTVTDAILDRQALSTEAIYAQDHLDTLLRDQPCFA